MVARRPETMEVWSERYSCGAATMWNFIFDVLFFWLISGERREDEVPRGCLPLLISALIWGGILLLVWAGLLAIFG